MIPISICCTPNHCSTRVLTSVARFSRSSGGGAQSFQLIANRLNDEVDFDLLRSLFAPNRFLFSWAQKSSDVGPHSAVIISLDEPKTPASI